MIHTLSFATAIGPITLKEEDGTLVSVLFSRAGGNDSTPLLEEAKRQILEYMEGKRKVFDLPLTFHGTEFQKKVWMAIHEIPYGEVRSYGELASSIHTKGYQALGSACGKNPLPIIVPCHRVISGDGTIGGFSADMAIKKHLLRKEGAVVKGL